MSDDTERAESLATAHWLYIESLLSAHGQDETTIEQCGFHYRTAFVHGWKHAMEHIAEHEPKWESKP